MKTKKFKFLLFVVIVIITGSFLMACIEDSPAITVATVTGVTITSTNTATTGSTRRLTARVTGQNNPSQAVTWTVLDGTGVATLSNNVLTGVSVGTVTVTATSTFDTSMSATQVVTVTAAQPIITGITITSADTAAVGKTLTPTATVTGQNNPAQTVTWSVANGTGSASLLFNDSLTGISPGTVTVTARSTINPSVFARQVIMITPTQPDQPTVTGVTITSTNTVAIGSERTLTAMVIGQNNPAQTVTWAVVNGTDSATLSGNVLTGVSVGTVTLTARSTINRTVFAMQVVTITPTTPTQPDQPTIAYVTITNANTVAIGSERTLTAIVTGQNNPSQTVTWSAMNGTGSATLSGNVLTGVNAGSVTVTATSTVNPNIYATQVVTVTPATPTQPAQPTVTDVTITSADTVAIGSERTLTAIVTGQNNPAQTVTWAVVNGTGSVTLSGNVLTGVNAGIIIVIATSTVNPNIHATQVVTVTPATPTQPDQPAITDVTITSLNTVTIGSGRTLTATVTGEDNPVQTVTWSAINGTGSATLSGNVLTGVSAGTVTVTATSTVNPNIYATQVITVTNPRHVGTYNINRVVIRVWVVNRWEETTHTSGSVFNSARTEFGARVVVTATHITFNGASPLNNTRSYTLSGGNFNTSPSLPSAFRVRFIAASPRDMIEITHTTRIGGRDHTVTVRFLN